MAQSTPVWYIDSGIKVYHARCRLKVGTLHVEGCKVIRLKVVRLKVKEGWDVGR
jgi:hypothetical protein